MLSRFEEGARLVTLTGPGGTGKTRLAIEAAATLVPEYKAGVFWVGLATLRDPALVTETIAQTLGAKDGLAEHIGEREMLLLLDNLEQVIDCAPGSRSSSTACPNLTLLVTSRELLRVQGEVEYAVPPLAEPEAVSSSASARSSSPSEMIAELCRRLDDLPLAVELAAARTNALTPEQILERLSQRLDLLKGGRDADPRQQTLRATIEWSYELLSSRGAAALRPPVRLRRRLHAGGRRGSLRCRSRHPAVARREEPRSASPTSRFWMLETIREFAAERLDEFGRIGRPTASPCRFVARLRRSPNRSSGSRGQDGDGSSDGSIAERLNFRGDLRVGHLVRYALLALRLVGSFWRFWWYHAHYLRAISMCPTALLAVR